jgi:hypothetical protein
MSIHPVEDYGGPEDGSGEERASSSRRYCELLEEGRILQFDSPPFPFVEEERAFLLQLKPTDSQLHKNISYRPQQDRLSGFSGAPPETERMHAILRDYSRRVTEFLSSFLAPYAAHWSLDYASFRPQEEEGRVLSLHKRNDLLHVDAFPSRPTRGDRILRIFTNIHRSKPRVWMTTDSFVALADRYAQPAGLTGIAAESSVVRKLRSAGSSMGRAAGLKMPDRSPYDRFMLKFHDYLKENADFQLNCEKIRIEFPPGSTWIAFTDAVPHAVLSGQSALEQTYVVPTSALLSPEKSPIRILEKLCGQPLD